jgi:hypothetical protein
MTTSILYNVAASPLRLDFPPDWPDGTTSVTVGVKGTDGTVLLAPAAATMFTATTTTAGLVAGDYDVLLTSITGLAVGDVLRVKNTLGRAEDIEIAQLTPGVAPAGKVTAVRAVRYDHAIGAAVTGRWATYNLNTTTVATWTKGREVQAIWQPYSTAAIVVQAHTELLVVRSQEFALPGLREVFANLYPDEYRVAEARWATLEDQARYRVQQRLDLQGRHLDALKDQRAAEPIMLDTIRLLVLHSGGSQWADEVVRCNTLLEAQWARLDASPLWFDTNQDDIKDTAKEIAQSIWRPFGRVW